MATRLRLRVARAVEERSAVYLGRHGEKGMEVGTVLFDRSRRICASGPLGSALLERFVGAA
jgi:cobalt-precorrin-5B (C1)-methyltransferase